MSSMKSSIVKSNDSFISFLEKPVVKYSILIFITLLIILIEKINIEYLEVFDLDIFKVVYALLIAYTACFDPIYAIILTTFMIIAIQEVHSRRTKNAIVNHKLKELETKKVKPSLIGSKINETNQTSQSVVYEEMPSNDILVNDKMVYDLINKQSLQKVPNAKDTLIGQYDYYEDPAFKTITNNLQEKNTMNKNQFFVTDDDLVKAQTNIQEGVNQNIAQNAFTPNILNIQGLPNGYDPKNSTMGSL